MRRFAPIATLLLISLQWAVAPRAYAQPDCNGMHVCLYEDANMTGCRYNMFGGEANLKDVRFFNCPDRDLDDKISSYANPTTDQYVVLWANPGYKGSHICIPPGASGNISRSFNDQASSSEAFYASAKPKEC